ncbi:hypothetical protein E4U52_004794 [Claviceps spartinae]|nr:hypothetical protein E4U52_004794 [Claviceps spartinae]
MGVIDGHVHTSKEMEMLLAASFNSAIRPRPLAKNPVIIQDLRVRELFGSRSRLLKLGPRELYETLEVVIFDDVKCDMGVNNEIH